MIIVNSGIKYRGGRKNCESKGSISISGIIVDGSTLVRSGENFHENELSLAVSHNGYVYGGGLTIGTTTCSMTVPFDDCNK